MATPDNLCVVRGPMYCALAVTGGHCADAPHMPSLRQNGTDKGTGA